MGLVLGLLFDAAIIGIVIAVMEKGEFPGWGPMIGCVFVIGVVSNGVAHFLPGLLALFGLVAGAAVGALMISWLCEMSLRRSAIASGIYLGVRLVLTLGVMLISSA